VSRSIGTLGRKREPLDLEFDYFGTRIRVSPDASDVAELEFLEIARGANLDMRDLEGLSAAELEDEAKVQDVVRRTNQVIINTYGLIRDKLREMIHPEDFDAYWRLARENRQMVSDLMADMQAITASVVEASTGFPTMPPADSPPTLASTLQNSGGGSSSAPASDTAKALELRRGRPDLQEFFVLAEEQMVSAG
jgi:hypothetical protein